MDKSFVPQAFDLFLILCDFTNAYDTFELKITDCHQYLDREILVPLRKDLAKHVEHLRCFDIEDVRNKIKNSIGMNYYTITMDGGTYFADYDSSLEITRACLALENSTCGPYLWLPRDGGRRLIAQNSNLRDAYEQHGENRPIALCDDGIGTGNSMRAILSMLENLAIKVSKIIVLFNPNNFLSIRSVGVNVILSFDETHEWLNERDLYWGIPRSGISYASYATNDGSSQLYGIPYTVDVNMVKQRIGLSHEAAVGFRESCLDANIKFWSYLEEKHGRPLFFEDCSRLKFFGQFLSIFPKRIVDFLNEIKTPDFSFVGLIKNGF